jgi:hypothetical protein
VCILETQSGRAWPVGMDENEHLKISLITPREKRWASVCRFCKTDLNLVIGLSRESELQKY